MHTQVCIGQMPVVDYFESFPMRKYMRLCVCVCTHARTCVCTRVSVRECVCVCVYARAHARARVCVCKLLKGVIRAQVAMYNVVCSLSSLQRWAGV